MKATRVLLICAVLAFASLSILAQTGSRGTAIEAKAESTEKQRESPWLLVPVFSVSPKLGTSLGAMVGYMHYFDEKSQVSMLGLNAQYTSTGSTVAGAFGKASYGEDHHRVIGMLVSSNIKNDYSDYLGTGVPLKSDDQVNAFATRYLYRAWKDWFVGVQAVYTDYMVLGESAFDQGVLDALAIKGFKSGGLGAVAYRDTRDNEFAPAHGSLINANNIAYRESLGGSQNFDVYRLDLRTYLPHSDGNVFAMRQFNQWTVDAPAAAYASVQLRGYKMGQYLGKYMSSFEVEERLRLGEKWTSTFFVGVACLYGGEQSCSDQANVYPDWGVGIQYVLRKKEGIVVNLEYAGGKDGNYGIYMKMGYGY
jgi:hypothetical protein